MMSHTETSIITSNVCQISISDENIKDKHCCFQISKIVTQKNQFDILIYILSWIFFWDIFQITEKKQQTKKQHWRIGWRFIIWRCERTPIKTAEFESRNTLNTILLIGMSSTFMKTTLHCQNLDIFWADLKNLTFFSMVTVTHHYGNRGCGVFKGGMQN